MFEFELNGRHVVVPDAAADMTLLDFIRAQGLTGAKEGCAEGECGACAVAVRCGDAGRSEYRAINSCLVLVRMVAGRDISTVEALSRDGRLSAVQQAMAAAGGSQCGYCTPGFVMSLFAEYYRPGRASACDPQALEGNLCRCTGYRPIADAARSLGPAPHDHFTDRLQQPLAPLPSLALDGFTRPLTIDDCVATLRGDPSAVLVAGGTDLIVERNLRHTRWPHLVSLEAIDDLRAFEITPAFLRIGAALPLTDLARQWVDAPVAVREWLSLFASPLIRNRATLGGNLATASPVGDSAPLLLALDASVELAGPGDAGDTPLSGAMDQQVLGRDPGTGHRKPGTGTTAVRRVLPLSAFFTGYRTTAMRPGEMIVAIRIPCPLPPALRFYKVSKRRLDDISTVAAAMAIDVVDGVVARARFAFGGVAATPVRIADAEAAIEGMPWNLAAVQRVQASIDRVLRPLSDHRGSREYRLAVARSLIEKFWWESQP